MPELLGRGARISQAALVACSNNSFCSGAMTSFSSPACHRYHSRLLSAQTLLPMQQKRPGADHVTWLNNTGLRRARARFHCGRGAPGAGTALGTWCQTSPGASTAPCGCTLGVWLSASTRCFSSARERRLRVAVRGSDVCALIASRLRSSHILQPPLPPSSPGREPSVLPVLAARAAFSPSPAGFSNEQAAGEV